MRHDASKAPGSESQLQTCWPPADGSGAGDGEGRAFPCGLLHIATLDQL